MTWQRQRWLPYDGEWMCVIQCISMRIPIIFSFLSPLYRMDFLLLFFLRIECPSEIIIAENGEEIYIKFTFVLISKTWLMWCVWVSWWAGDDGSTQCVSHITHLKFNGVRAILMTIFACTVELENKFYVVTIIRIIRIITEGRTQNRNWRKHQDDVDEMQEGKRNRKENILEERRRIIAWVCRMFNTINCRQRQWILMKVHTHT